MKEQFTPFYVEGSDGNQYDIANRRKMTQDGKITPMTENEAKSYLSEYAYKLYQDKK